MNTTIDLAPRRRAAMTMSIVLHALLVLLLMWLTIQGPDPPLPGPRGDMELGLADLGYSDVGMGETEEMDAGSSGAPQESTPVETNPGDVIAEEDGEPINVPVKDPNKPVSESTVVKPPKKDPPKISEPEVSKGFQNAFNNAFNNKGNSSGQTGSGGDGNSSTPGNQGVPGGNPNGGGGGPGSGGLGPGVSWSLAGRQIVRKPDLSEKPTESGKVVLYIFVDKSGKVVRTARNTGKSTTVSSVLFDLASRQAMTAVYSPMPDLIGEQKGEVVFNFELK
jgi:outer membrane biosynthesis protein TonB